MTKVKKHGVIFISLLLLLSIFLTFFINLLYSENNKDFNYNKNSFATSYTGLLAQNTLAGNFNVKITSRDNQDINLDTTTPYYDGQAYSIEWSNAEQFTISFNVDENNPPPLNPNNPDNNETYVLSLSVRFLKGYLENNIFEVNETITLENVYVTQETTNYNNFSNLNFSFDIDDGLNGIFGGNSVNISGWGIYQFVVDINGADAYSNYYAITPTSEIANAPEISYNTISSPNSLHDSFQFYLENFDEYEFIDSTCLTWYVKGESEDGTIYALCAEDLEKESFSDCADYLYDSYERTGQTFLFNDDEISGTWQVWCVYKANNSNTSLTSDSIEVKTGFYFNYFIIVYIIIALAVLAIILVIVFAKLKNKKEKVW